MNVMTKEEIAQHLRGIADAASLTTKRQEQIRSIADELDPPKLKPGQVAVDISTLRYLVRVAEESMFNISEHFDRSVAVSDAKNVIAEAERMEAGDESGT